MGQLRGLSVLGCFMPDKYLLDDDTINNIHYQICLFCNDYLIQFKEPYPRESREKLLKNLIICAISKEDYEITVERAKRAIKDSLKETEL